MVLTEDTGKQLEMALCLAYNIPYQGKYKYGLEEPTRIAEKIKHTLPPFEGIRHTAEKGSPHDYTHNSGYLSLKSNKKTGGKVAPQLVGQASPKTFCERMDIPVMEPPELKEYIQTNIQTLLPTFEQNTFDCPIIYFDKQKDTLRHIERLEPFDWSGEVSWTKHFTTWSNSSTLKIDGTSLMEIQFHTKRKNMACRWCFENVLRRAASKLRVVLL